MTNKEIENKVGDFITENHQNGYSAFALLVKDGKALIEVKGNPTEIVAGLVSFIDDKGLNNTFIDVLNLLKEERKRNN